MVVATTRLVRLAAAAAAALVLAAPLGGAGAQDIAMKLSTATINDGQHEWAKRFAQRVEAKSGGKLKPQIFPASQLGSIPRQIEGVQLGTIECYIGPPEFFVGIDPRYQVLGAPGVFADADHVMRTISEPAFRAKFLAIGEAKNLKGIGLIYLAPTSIAFIRPVRTLDDFKGKKIRVFGSPMQTLPMQLVGAAGVPLPLDETLPALQSGTVDGAFGSMAIFVPMKYFNLAKYLTDTNASAVTTLIVVGKAWFDKLPADIQKTILEEAQAIEPEIGVWSKNFAAAAIETWKQNGGEYIQLSAPDRAELMKRWGTIGETVLADKPAIKEMYDLMVTTAKARM